MMGWQPEAMSEHGPLSSPGNLIEQQLASRGWTQQTLATVLGVFPRRPPPGGDKPLTPTEAKVLGCFVLLALAAVIGMAVAVAWVVLVGP